MTDWQELTRANMEERRFFRVADGAMETLTTPTTYKVVSDDKLIRLRLPDGSRLPLTKHGCEYCEEAGREAHLPRLLELARSDRIIA